MFAGSGLAGAGLGPREGWSEVVLASVEGVLPGDKRGDLIAGEKSPYDEVTFGCEEFALAFVGAQLRRGLVLCDPD
jgi:hypothetical protein